MSLRCAIKHIICIVDLHLHIFFSTFVIMLILDTYVYGNVKLQHYFVCNLKMVFHKNLKSMRVVREKL